MRPWELNYDNKTFWFYYSTSLNLAQKILKEKLYGEPKRSNSLRSASKAAKSDTPQVFVIEDPSHCPKRIGERIWPH